MLKKLDEKTYDLNDRDQRINYGIKRWEPFIESLAIKFRNPVCGREDLVQEAKMKVIRAADLWDPQHESGTSWETYAFTAIKNAIIEAATRNSYAMSIPSGSIDSVPNVNALRSSKLNDDVPDDRGDPRDVMEILDTMEEFDHYRVGEMYFVEGRTMSEISGFTSMSISTISRIIRRMKEMLETRLTV